MVGQTTAAEASDGFSCDYVWMERLCPAQTELGGNVHRFFISFFADDAQTYSEAETVNYYFSHCCTVMSRRSRIGIE